MACDWMVCLGYDKNRIDTWRFCLNWHRILRLIQYIIWSEVLLLIKVNCSHCSNWVEITWLVYGEILVKNLAGCQGYPWIGLYQFWEVYMWIVAFNTWAPNDLYFLRALSLQSKQLGPWVPGTPNTSSVKNSYDAKSPLFSWQGSVYQSGGSFEVDFENLLRP